MKKLKQSLLLLTLFFAAFQTLRAQDVITLKNGDDIKAKIVEVGTTEVKYKKADNPNGPAYAIIKADIFMIRYENGSKDVFKDAVAPAPSAAPVQNNNAGNNQPKENNARKKADDGINNLQAQQEYDKNNKLFKSKLRKGIVMTAIGAPMIVIGLGLIGGGVSYAYTLESDQTPAIIMAALGGAFVLAGIPLTIIGPIQIASAIKYKRKAKEAKASMSFEPVLRPMSNGGGNRAMGFAGGMGIKLKF